MLFRFYIDNNLVKVEADPMLKLSSYLRTAYPKVQFITSKEFVFIDNNLYDSDYLPLERLQGKKIQTMRGFFEMSDYRQMIQFFVSTYGPVCPLCFQQRFFLGCHAFELLQSNKMLKIKNILKWYPCYCQQDKYILKFLFEPRENVHG